MTIFNYPAAVFLAVALPCCLTGNIASAEEAVTTREDAENVFLEKKAEEYNAKKDNERAKVVCRKEAPIGSRIKQRVCRTVYSRERDAKAARQMMDRTRTTFQNPQ